jgi:opacity protein-like surface antigen
MKRNLLGLALAVAVLVPASFAQSSSSAYNHAEIGAFVNYTRLHNANDTNFYGFGGRLGFNVTPHVQLEAEGAYDFQRNLDTQVSTGNFNSQRSKLRMAHFMAGPKFQFGTSGPVRVFVTVKGGLIDFSNDPNFGSQVSNIPFGNTKGVLYPGGGIEFYAGWLGLRFEAGDEIYFNNGGNHNLRITAGPTIRF